jgi:molecular chaperone DnaK (HSP70)
MTREKLNEFLRDLEHPSKENKLDKWRREVREQEERFAREREKSRNLTDSEMQRWCQYFESLITSERAATAELVSNERNFQLEVMAQVLAEVRHEIEDENKQAIDAALAGVQAHIDALRQEITRRAAVEAGDIVELPNPLVRHGAAS